MTEINSSSSPGDLFASALELNAARYQVTLDAGASRRLREYFETLSRWNRRLHLVAPCTPEEFATRHVLESLVALRHLPPGARLADVGSGGGLPAIPCLLVRPDLRIVLVESSLKKAVFLREALLRTGSHPGSTVVADRFQHLDPPDVEFVTCRALERFTEVLQELILWAPAMSTLLLFGGPSLERKIRETGLVYSVETLPGSHARSLFLVPPRASARPQE